MTGSTDSGTWIHVGLPKTGTKTLQAFLFAEHPELWYMGALQHEARRRGMGKAGKWRDSDCSEVARCVMESVSKTQLVDCVATTQRVLEGARDQRRRFLMSASTALESSSIFLATAKS